MKNKVIQIIQDATSKHIVDENSVIADLGLDSLDCVETIMCLEEEFNIEIPDAECEALKTVQDVIKLVERKIQKLTI